MASPGIETIESTSVGDPGSGSAKYSAKPRSKVKRFTSDSSL